jgi:putative SOS response-associated peptidase YedK
VPADGFYEWKRDGKVKQPFFIHRKDEEPFAFAGLWEAWENPEDGNEVQSCSLITTEASALMAPIHDRMPVILPAPAYDRWARPGRAGGRPAISSQALPGGRNGGVRDQHLRQQPEESRAEVH